MNSQTRIKRYFAKARQASLMSDYHKEHIGAVLVYSNSILATGFNTLKTTPVQKEYNLERGINDDNVNNGACHAEMMCLLKTKYLDIDWSKAKMYIYRENKNIIIL